MCGGGGGNSVTNNLAIQSAAQEQARQDRIKEGMRQLEIMFSGGNTPTGQVGAGARYDPNQTYYDKNGNVWAPGDVGAYRAKNPVMLTAPYNEGGGEGGNWVAATYGPDVTTSDDAIRQRMFDDAMGGGLYTGVQANTGFDDAFFDKAYQAQLDYALPQVDKQFAEAQRNLEFALARQGLSASSQGENLRADLNNQRALAVQGEQDKANTVRTQQQQAVEEERDNLTKLLQSTGDVESTMNMASARKNMLSAAPSLATVGPLFQNATGTLADMIVSPALRGAQSSSSSSGYGSSSKGSGKVVN